MTTLRGNMTQSNQPTTKTEFGEQLEELIRTAESNDVDITGGYTFRTDGDGADWNLELFTVTKPPKIDR